MLSGINEVSHLSFHEKKDDKPGYDYFKRHEDTAPGYGIDI